MLGSQTRFQVPMHVIEYLRRPCMRVRHAVVSSSMLHGYPVSVTTMLGSTHCRSRFYNAFINRHGDLAPHSFSFRHRGALTTAQVDTVEYLPGHYGPNALEYVVCCVKAYTRSIDLMHPPALVIPVCCRGLSPPRHQLLRIPITLDS